MCKRILVISNNCFSLENSNGRTLANLLNGWPMDCIAQFYTHDELPNSIVCGNYFRVTDKQAVLSIFRRGFCGKIEKVNLLNQVDSSHKSYRKFRNPFNLIMRNIIWNIGFWKGSAFKKWINNFNPEIVLVQAGDTAYRLKLATDIAKKRFIPLIIYNSEGYYFKKNNYMTTAKLSKCLYPLFINNFKKQLKKTISYASHTIYCCEPLKKDFDAEFGKPSSVIYIASEIEPKQEQRISHNKLKISYLGNLGLGRHESLIVVSKIIQKIDPTLAIDVYGKCPNESVFKTLKRCQAINVKGFISYQEVQQVISKSDILLHVENFSDFYVEDIKYGFSTKIADSLMSGRCFFMYSPKNLACSKYMLKNNPDGIATSIEELEVKMKRLLLYADCRRLCAVKGIKLARKNHSLQVVNKKFTEVVNSLF